jgi:hypothetical protein
MERVFTRRGFLARAGAVAAALALPLRAFAAPKTTPIYKLDTGCGNGSCACNACFDYDTHSLFPTQKAADGNRAHIGCNCLIVQGSIQSGAYVSLFGDPNHLANYRVDTRSPRVQALLRKHPAQF